MTRRSSFSAVCRTEVLFNLRRLSPYLMALAFSANAAFWWAVGPAESRGWATNSDFFIMRMFEVFTFMTVPLFLASMMADPVIRDFDVGIDPLVFSKPVRRLEYLLGKFVGNFVVLAACQACFALTLLVLQWFAPDDMLVLPPRVGPFVVHFLVTIVLSSLLPAAACFAVGTLSRSVKTVYALVACGYVAYVSAQVSMKHWPRDVRVLVDPLLMNFGEAIERTRPVEWLNQGVVAYDGPAIINRVLVVLAAALCLTIVHLGFAGAIPRMRRPRRAELAASVFERAEPTAFSIGARSSDLRTAFDQVFGSVLIELRLLAAERSIVVIVPLIALTSIAAAAYYPLAASLPASVQYATRSAEALSFLLAVAGVFLIVESMFRDRTLGVESLVWSRPIGNFLLVIPKCAAVVVVQTTIAVSVALVLSGAQIARGQGGASLATYANVYFVLLLPGLAFCIAAAAASSIAFRERYVTYAVVFSVAAALYAFYGTGHLAWWYNPLLYRLWTPADFVAPGAARAALVDAGGYWLACSVMLLLLAVAGLRRHRPT